MNNKTAIRVIKIKGIVLTGLGLVHFIASYFEYEKIKNQMSATLSHDYLTWFNAVGLFIIFIGTIDLYVIKALKASVPIAWTISFISSIGAGLMGMMGIIAFSFIPSPPYLIFITGLISGIGLLQNKKYFTVNTL